MGTYDSPGSAGPVTTTDDKFHDIYRFNMASVGSQSGAAHCEVRVVCRNVATNDLAVWSQKFAISIDGRDDGAMTLSALGLAASNKSLGLQLADIKITSDQHVLVVQGAGVFGTALVWGAFVAIGSLLDEPPQA